MKRSSSCIILHPSHLILKSEKSKSSLSVINEDDYHITNQLRKISGTWSIDPRIFVDVNLVQGEVKTIVRVEDEEKNEIIKQHEPKAQTFLQKYLGIIFALASVSIFSLCNILVKLLHEYHPFNIAFWRFTGLLFPSIILVSYKHWVHPDKDAPIFESIYPIIRTKSLKNIGKLIFRSAAGSTAVVLSFFALKYINVADASVISFSSPIVITILAYFFLHEGFSIVQFVCSITSLFGVIIISRPPFLTGADGFDSDTLIGSGLTFAATILASIVIICLRQLRNINYILITFILGVWGTGQTFLLAYGFGILEFPNGSIDWLLAGALATLTFLAQTLLTLALRYEQSGIVSLVRCLDIVFSFIYQFIFLSVIPDLYSMIGALIVIGAVILIGIRKYLLDLPEENRIRQKLFLLLK